MGTDFNMYKEKNGSIVNVDFEDMSSRAFILMRIVEILDGLNLNHDFLIYVNDEFSLCEEDEPYYLYEKDGVRKLYPNDIKIWQDNILSTYYSQIDKCMNALLKLEINEIKRLHAPDSVWFDRHEIEDLELFRKTVKRIFDKIKEGYVFYELSG